MEMHKDIDKYDSEDVGLKKIMGEHFVDETTEKPTAASKDISRLLCLSQIVESQGIQARY